MTQQPERASGIDTVVVVVGGEAAIEHRLPELPPAPMVVAADSGLDLVHRLGWRADLAIGDFDSASEAAMERARAEGTVFERHPPVKDATDLELALDAAMVQHPTRIVVVGGHGGRLDHLLGNVLLLGAEAYAAVEIDAYAGPASIHVVRRHRELEGTPGELLTLVALHGRATGVTTEGLRYPLRGEALEPGSSRGLSNQFTDRRATISVGSGTVLAICPGEPGPPR